MKDYNCTNLDEIAEYIGETRCDLLFSFDDAGMSPMAEQYYLAALASLEQANRMLMLAHYAQMKNQ